MPVGLGGIVCRECGGLGCSLCKQSGYYDSYFKNHPVFEQHEDIDIVPMPYGKILPDLTDCDYVNEPWPKYLDPILCPACESDHVVILDKRANPWLDDEQEILAERFFCISCQDSWCFEWEH